MPVVMSRPTPGIEEPKPLDVQPDGQVLVNTIMRRYGMCEPNITGPHYFKQALNAWWATVKPIAGSLWWTTQAEYNPIENYDRNEKTDYQDNDNKQENTKTDNVTKTDDVTSTDNKTTTDSTDGVETDNTMERKVSAFNSTGYQPAEQNTEDIDSTTTFHGTENLEGKVTLDGTQALDGNMDYKTENVFKHDYTSRIHGNIGVTTSQQMLQAERELVMFNWYETIARMFAEEFLLLVW